MPANVTETESYPTTVSGPAGGDPRTAASVRNMGGPLASRTAWLRAQMRRLLGTETRISAVDTSADALTAVAHGLVSNDAVQLFAATGGSLPGGVSAGVVYYVDVPDADTVELYSTSGPSGLIDITAGLSGDVYISKIPGWMNTLMIADATYGSGTLRDLVVWKAGAQSIAGAKTFADITVSGTAKVKYASRGLTRVVRGAWTDDNENANYPTFFSVQGNHWYVALEAPHGATLTGVTMYIDPDAHGSLPQNMPTIDVIKVAVATGAPTTVGSAPDPSLSAGAYSASHSISLTGLSEVIDNAQYLYVLSFTVESGTNAMDDTKILGATMAMTITSADDGAS